MRSMDGGEGALARLVVLTGMVFPASCGGARASELPRVAPISSAVPPASTVRAPPVDITPGWPAPLADALVGRGEPHAQPIALPRDARGRTRWLVFAGTREVAWGAWRVWRAQDGTTEIQPVERWPAGVRVLGGIVESGVAYILLQSVGVLDQPSGLRGTWIDTGGPLSAFDASPMALSGVRDTADLASRLKRAPPVERDAGALVAALRAASASTSTLASSLATDGADVQLAWQSLFTQRVGHLDADATAASPLAGAVLAILRDALATQACGVDTCEAWTDGGRAIVRFARQDGRWLIRAIIADAPVARSTTTASPPRVVAADLEATETELVLRARAREVRQVLGQAQLASSGGTIGVGVTDLAPDTPVVVVREGDTARVFAIDAGAACAESGSARWEAAFADVDGDGRTDVIVRMSGTGAGGLPLAWTQAFIAPLPSVQPSSLEADLASALALMDTPDVASAARAAASIPLRGIAHDDACRLLTAASTPAGFRRQAAPDARLLHFDEPGMPTWRPKVVRLGKLVADDLRGIGAHCAELACSATRPYCAWRGGTDSEHFWFDWRDGRLEIIGAADYAGE
ncbi:MAG: hypothetical protein M3O46_16950 [Myxococcota bacterium]|nr:hypothetical protein [Myxococcota bacterium]